MKRFKLSVPLDLVAIDIADVILDPSMACNISRKLETAIALLQFQSTFQKTSAV